MARSFASVPAHLQQRQQDGAVAVNVNVEKRHLAQDGLQDAHRGLVPQRGRHLLQQRLLVACRAVRERGPEVAAHARRERGGEVPRGAVCGDIVHLAAMRARAGARGREASS